VRELIRVLFLQVLSGFPPDYLGGPHGCPRQEWICDLPRRPPRLHDLRILLADGDAVSAEVTRKLLERLDCEVVLVLSAADCLSLLASVEPPFQLVVLDLNAVAMDW
jgi:PleD family two-component response regulator